VPERLGATAALTKIPSANKDRAIEKMTLISESELSEFATVAPPDPKALPVYRGPGPVDCACGKCGKILIEGMEGNLCRIAVKCPHCGSFNVKRFNTKQDSQSPEHFP
jgi:phage FluMu protein Com